MALENATVETLIDTKKECNSVTFVLDVLGMRWYSPYQLCDSRYAPVCVVGDRRTSLMGWIRVEFFHECEDKTVATITLESVIILILAAQRSLTA